MLKYNIMIEKYSKTLILNKIKSHYGFKKGTQFAEFLGITQSALANWLSRDTFDIETLITKCEDINPRWMLTGVGEMLNPVQKQESASNTNDNMQALKLSLSLIEQKNKMLEERITEIKKHNEDLRKNNQTLNAVVMHKIGEK